MILYSAGKAFLYAGVNLDEGTICCIVCDDTALRGGNCPPLDRLFAGAHSTKQNAARASGDAAAVDTSVWKTYRNVKHGFEVRYPETWGLNAGSGTGSDIITITKPLRNGEPNASLTLAVQKNQNPQKLSIEQWYAGQMKLMNAHPESSGSVMIGGRPALFMENTNSFGKQRDTFTLLNQTDVLSLSYKRQTELDATYRTIVASFRVLR